MAPIVTVTPVAASLTDNETNQWVFRLILTVVTFLLGWGMKDIKKRYDKVPELEKILVALTKELEEINHRLDKLER